VDRDFIARIAGAVIAVVIVGCSESVANDVQTCPSANVPLCKSADSTKALLTPLTSDAVTRIVNALGNASSKSALTDEMTAIVAAVNAGEITKARASIERARTALAAARAATTHPGDAPDLGAYELALIQIERAIK
jgi:hypothetical protein